jgi:hypothetical protein
VFNHNREGSTVTREVLITNPALAEELEALIDGYGLETVEEALRELRKEQGSYDPTPWCSACGAKTLAQCKCGPIAGNE